MAISSLVAGSVVMSELVNSTHGKTDLAAPAFGAAATLAALYLPAAGLANQYVTATLPGLANDLVTSNSELAPAIVTVAENLRKSVMGLPTCFVLIVGAFGLSAIALVHPSLVIFRSSTRFLQVSLTSMLIGSSLAVDFGAVCRMLTLARELISTKNLDAVADAARNKASPPSSPPPKSEPAR